MEVIYATSESFEKEIEKGTVIVDFYADWCSPCQILSPILDQIATELPDVKIVKVDVDASEDIARKYSVTSMPTLIAFKNAERIDHTLGVRQKQELIDWIQSL